MKKMISKRHSGISDTAKPGRMSLAAKLVLALVVVLMANAKSFAQNTANNNVTISATVIQGLTLAVSGGPLNFGTVVAGTAPSAISAQSSSVLFTVTGNGGSSVTVTYSGVTLNGPGGSTLIFTPSVYGSSSSSGQASSTNVPSGANVTLNGSNFSAGNYYLWLGGNLGAIPSGQTPGAYTGTFTMTVNY